MKTIRKIFFFFPVIFFLVCPDGQAAGETSGDTTGYDVQWYFLQLSVNDSNTFLAGSATVLTMVTADTLSRFVLDFTDSLTVDSVKAGREDISWDHTQGFLTVRPAAPWHREEPAEVTVYYHGFAPTGGFFSAVTSKEDQEWHQRVTWTLSEPFAAREWFPCKQDLRDKADSSAVWITVDTGLVAGSNGLLQGVDTLAGEGKVRYRWHHHHPIDYYLISFAVSAYRVVDQYAHDIRQPGDSLLIRNLIYRDPAFLEKNRENMEATVNLIELYSRLFGPYPFSDEKYGHCLAPMGGGMEHQTMTTAASLAFLLVAHEMAHQWFGDYVTCATWQDIWINEGFASYVEYIALENMKSREEANKWMERAHDQALKEDDGSVYVPLEDIDDVWRIFSGRLSYKKGASILHMMRYELDDDTLFYRVLDTYLETFGDSTATGRDFEEVLEQVSGDDFGWFFDQWYYGRGYPRFGFVWYQRNDTLFINCEESPSGSTPFFRTHLDFLVHTTGGDTLVRYLVDEPYEDFALPLKEVATGVTVDPRGWVLKKIDNISHVINPGNEEWPYVYPNPAGDEVNIYLPTAAGVTLVEVMNSGGQKVLVKSLPMTPCQLSLATLPEGFYLLRISNGNRVWVRKLVIRR